MLSQITSFLMLLKDMLIGSTHTTHPSPTSLSTASRGRDILLHTRPQAELLFCSTPDCKRNCYFAPHPTASGIAMLSQEKKVVGLQYLLSFLLLREFIVIINYYLIIH